MGRMLAGKWELSSVDMKEKQSESVRAWMMGGMMDFAIVSRWVKLLIVLKKDTMAAQMGGK